MALEQCPCCERPFKELEDFPRVYVASATTIKSEDVPAELPHWWEESLLIEPKKSCHPAAVK